MKKQYGMFQFLVDATLTVVSGGLWLIWIFCRESRSRQA